MKIDFLSMEIIFTKHCIVKIKSDVIIMKTVCTVLHIIMNEKYLSLRAIYKCNCKEDVFES